MLTHLHSFLEIQRTMNLGFQLYQIPCFPHPGFVFLNLLCLCYVLPPFSVFLDISLHSMLGLQNQHGDRVCILWLSKHFRPRIQYCSRVRAKLKEFLLLGVYLVLITC